MLSQGINDQGLLFKVNYNGCEIPFYEWSATDDCIYFMPLATLVDNGYATVSQDGCQVPFENIYLLDDEERMLLGIPPVYDKTLRLRGEGMLNTPDFRYKLEYLTRVPDGDLLSVEREGNILTFDNNKNILSEKQYELLKRVEAYNAREKDVKTTDYNLRSFAEIKELAIDSGCHLDSYLENENVVVPERIKIKIGRDEDGYTIDPSIDIEENEKFMHTFDRMRKVQTMYPLQRDNGERVRVVLDPEQKANLEYLKRGGGRHKTREQIKELTDRPTEFFNPDLFDLTELYSDRVIEIGIYKPHFFPFICPYRSEWIAGATIETPENGTSKITITTQAELQRLLNDIHQAESENKCIVEYKNTKLDIEDAKFLAVTAQRQLKTPSTPIEMDNDGKLDGRKVLIIEENAEELGFVANNVTIERDEKYTLFKNPFLKGIYSLKTHQEEGVAWLQYLYEKKANGCLLADDMGLGKTLQVLYFIDWHSRNYKQHKPYLIVAPISLLQNWENEYTHFFGSPRLRISKLSSREVPRHYDKNIVERMQGFDIILTNYESLRIAQLNFCAVDFDIVVLDEAQKIKTPGTLVTNAAKALKSRFKIAITGTPVENSLLDLWCIMDFCVPGLLGNAKAFAAKYQYPLKHNDIDIISLGNEVHEQLGIYFMRRLKKDAAKDLPEKIEMKQPTEMPDKQKSVYQTVVNDFIEGNHSNMLQTIFHIKEISEHPYLFECSLMQHNSEELIETSARLQATISFLDNIREREEKAIIFAERKDIQKMLQNVCLERYGLVPRIINGDTPATFVRQIQGNMSRQACVDFFQESVGFNIIIMSPIAAGVGLNVTAANHVIHYSRHWNPAKENQATDRAYRIGQVKNVIVYYPMAVSSSFKSFDETLDELLTRKTALAASTIFPTERVEINSEELGQVLFGLNSIDID